MAAPNLALVGRFTTRKQVAIQAWFRMNDKTLADLDEKTITLSRQEEPDEADISVGRIFAQKYEILSLLGRGGMSVVYRARHVGMNKIVALKIMQLHLTRDDNSIRRFKQEAQTASKLNHQGIIKVHDCGEGDNGMPYLVMDYVDGKSLGEIVKHESGPLVLERFLLLLEQVASALAFAHQNSVVHRDLKPSNIMVTLVNGKEEARVLDFGIAKTVAESSETFQNLTQTGEVFGSPLYMSPEQCNGSAVDRRADIYSMGCVMYECLAGKVPHQGNSLLETMQKHVNDSPPPLEAPQLPDEYKNKLETMILRCLAKDPDDRFQNMVELESELRSLRLKSKPGLLSSLSAAWEHAAAKRRAKKKNKFPLVVTALLTISIMSVISTVMLTMRLQEADDNIAKLEQSRVWLQHVGRMQQQTMTYMRACSQYIGTAVMQPESEETEKYSEALAHELAVLSKELDDLRPMIGDDKKLKKEYEWMRKRLVQDDAFARARVHEIEQANRANDTPMVSTLANMMRLMNRMDEGMVTMRRLWDIAEKTAQVRAGKLNYTNQWVRYLAFTSILLGGTAVASLAFYFAKGTPQRLKNLASQAALLRKRGGAGTAPPTSDDELTDLDNVLHELANALSEAEEREKALLEKLKEKTLQ